MRTPSSVHEDEEALASLRGFGELARFAPPNLMTPCPYCHQGFGSASLPIHVRRCRAQQPQPSPEGREPAEAVAKAQSFQGKKRLKPLVDLCLDVITRNFTVTCMDKIYTQPEAQAALIDSLPSHLVHRIIMNLLVEIKELRGKEQSIRARWLRLKQQLPQFEAQEQQLQIMRRELAACVSRTVAQQQEMHHKTKDLEACQSQLQMCSSGYDQLTSELAKSRQQNHIKQQKINSLVQETAELKRQLTISQHKEHIWIKETALLKRQQVKTQAKKSPNNQKKQNQAICRERSSNATRWRWKRQLFCHQYNTQTRIPLPPGLSEAYLSCLIGELNNNDDSETGAGLETLRGH